MEYYNETDDDNIGNQIVQSILAEAFTDWRSILFGILLAILLTLPAVTLYHRKTRRTIPREYLYSCIVKFLASCVTGPVLIKSFININEENTTLEFTDITSWVAAWMTEGIEFGFDVFRFILFYNDPDIIDCYQNTRWRIHILEGCNLATQCCFLGVISLPMIITMFVMYIVVLIANIAAIVTETETKWFIYFILILNALGGVYLLSMFFCCGKNDGEKKGMGYKWSRFKLIAVDIPSLVTSLFNPSSLLLYWISECATDFFPFLFVKCLKKYSTESSLEGNDIENIDGNNSNFDGADDGITLNVLETHPSMNASANWEGLIPLEVIETPEVVAEIVNDECSCIVNESEPVPIISKATVVAIQD
jgi:hypothetical protein